MNTDKPGRPIISAPSRRLSPAPGSSPEAGLARTEAATRLQQSGENALPQKPGKPAWRVLLRILTMC